jgi:hypothetical protein
LIKDKRAEEPIFVQVLNKSSLLITRYHKIAAIQELIKSENSKRLLNNDPLFSTYPGGSIIATLTIPLGTSQDVIYPSINDEHPTWVEVRQWWSSIPHSSKIV